MRISRRRGWIAEVARWVAVTFFSDVLEQLIVARTIIETKCFFEIFSRAAWRSRRAAFRVVDDAPGPVAISSFARIQDSVPVQQDRQTLRQHISVKARVAGRGEKPDLTTGALRGCQRRIIALVAGVRTAGGCSPSGKEYRHADCSGQQQDSKEALRAHEISPPLDSTAVLDHQRMDATVRAGRTLLSGKRASQCLQIFKQGRFLLGIEFRAIKMPLISIAALRNVYAEADALSLGGLCVKPDAQRIVDVVPAPEDFCPAFHRLKHFPQVGYGAIVQIRRAHPKTVERNRLITLCLRDTDAVDMELCNSIVRSLGGLCSPGIESVSVCSDFRDRDDLTGA